MDRIISLLRYPLVWIGAGAGLLTLIMAPEIFAGSVSDLDTFIRVAGLGTSVLLWVVLINRFVPNQWLKAGLTYGPVIVILAYLMWPYLRPPTEVDEAFPPVAVAAETDDTASTPEPPPDAGTPAAPSELEDADNSSTTTTVVPEPVELRRSQFQGLTGHRGSGDAALYRLADNTTLLRFEDVDIGSGPRLEVYLVPGEDQRNLNDAVHVAPLTAERGNQNYTIPDGVDLTDGPWTVLVWCETFAIEIANATLT